MILLVGIAIAVPIWLLGVITGLVLLLIPKLRHLSSYLITAATLGAVGANACALAFFLGLVALGITGTNQSRRDLLTTGYMVGLLAGGVLGILAGMRIARKLNRSLTRQALK